VAKDVVGLTDPNDIDTWVTNKQTEVITMFTKLQPDDVFFHGITDKVNSVGAGDKMPDIPGIWSILRLRLIQGLKQMPTLMGVVEGSTESWSSVDWQIYAKGLESIVETAAAPLVRAADLHLRLLGMPLKAHAEIEPVRANQRLSDAQAEGFEIANEARKRDEGWQSQEASAMNATGSGPVAPGPIYRREMGRGVQEQVEERVAE
jgi:hypothetical protein